MRLKHLIVLVLLAACERKKPAPPAVAPAPAHTMTGPRQPAVISRLVPIAEAEAAPLLPAPTGARELAHVAHAQVGERIEGSWCYDAGSLADLGAALAAQYRAAGWQEVTLHPNPSLPERMTLTGSRPPYALYGNLAHDSTRPECRGADGKTYVALGVHHVEAVPPPSNEVGARGTTGLRGP
jgi:hypothetical protein